MNHVANPHLKQRQKGKDINVLWCLIRRICNTWTSCVWRKSPILMLLGGSVDIYKPPALDKFVVIYIVSHLSQLIAKYVSNFLTYSELLGILTFLARITASKVDKKEKEARTGYIFCSLFKVWSQLALQIPQNPWSWGPVANGVLGNPHIHVFGKWLLLVSFMSSPPPLHDKSCDCCGFPLETSSCSQEGWEQFLGCSCRCNAG